MVISAKLSVLKCFAGEIEANQIIYSCRPTEGGFSRTARMGKEVEACEK